MKPEPEKILDRAEERLRELPQASGEETLSLLRGFLRMESHRLRMLHRYAHQPQKFRRWVYLKEMLRSARSCCTSRCSL